MTHLCPPPAPTCRPSSLPARSHRLSLVRSCLRCRHISPLRLAPRLCRLPTAGVFSGGNNKGPGPTDELEVACLRLRDLVLECAEWDWRDAVRAEVNGYEPGSKLILYTSVGTAVSVWAIIACWVGHQDPLGGIRLSQSSMDAMVAGLACAAPLAALSLLLRTPRVRRALPVMEDLHSTQAEVLEPYLKGLEPTQLVIMAGSLVLPTVLLLLPGMHAFAYMCVDVLRTDVFEELGLTGALLPLLGRDGAAMLQANADTAVALAGSAAAAGWLMSLQLAVKPSAVAAVRDGVEGADRYFRLAVSMQQGVLAEGSSASASDSASASGDVAEGQQQVQHANAALDGEAAIGRQRGDTGGSVAFAAEAPEATAASCTPCAVGDGPSSSADALGGVAPSWQRASHAFKLVSLLWLRSRRRVAQVGCALAALNVAYLCLIWDATHDLAAPAATAMAAAMLEMHLVSARLQRQEKRRRAGADSGSADGAPPMA